MGRRDRPDRAQERKCQPFGFQATDGKTVLRPWVPGRRQIQEEQVCICSAFSFVLAARHPCCVLGSSSYIHLASPVPVGRPAGLSRYGPVPYGAGSAAS
ncbi:hypothetical protein DPEC_G00268410 [Dallia pectoralis]|uniref:Uncharacterized protein n=1 Tax=Dallia pectoralis TaxID=75939 RepID=A0ACC2FNR7_DALPE|nr:hypothetical protein DPEC_G00268410 [Dallia pectoralis]